MNEFENKLKLAEEMARKGHLSRRDFIQLAMATGIAIPMASTMFSKTQAAEPKKGGTLRLVDEKGRVVVVPTKVLGYVECGGETERRVGFGAL